LDPSQVAELAIHGDAQHFGVFAGEIRVAVAERRDFSWANKGEIKWVEKQHHVLTAVLRQADLFELLINYSGSGEIRGLLAHAQATVVGHDESSMGT
jgi:hypothetical protein